MNTQSVVIIGHSHVGALKDALQLRQAQKNSPQSAQYYVHDVWAKKTDYADSNLTGGIDFNPNVLSLIDSVVPTHTKRRYVTMLGGNAHIILALGKHPRSLDFILPENPHLPIDKEAELVTFEYIKKILEPLMMPYVWQLIAFRQALGHSFICVDTPPPYGDDEYVSSHLGSYIQNPKNIVNRYVRYKFWRLHSLMLKNFCIHNDVEFMDVPSESTDSEGFLRCEGYGVDATHANSWYGELILKKIEEKLNITYENYKIFS